MASRHDTPNFSYQPYGSAYSSYSPLPAPAPAMSSPFLRPTDEPGPSLSTTPNAYEDHARNDYLDVEPLSRQVSDHAYASDTIPLTQQRPKYDPSYRQPSDQNLDPIINAPERVDKSRFNRIMRRTPWLVYTISLIQIIVFIVELVKSSQLTGSPIETKPQINPMIGPSPYVLINMGARYVPCMRNEQAIQVANKGIPVYFPCPNTTSNATPTCSLTELCGMSPAVPDPNNPNFPHTLNQTPAPNQWFRFITPIFLHGGFIHIGANLLLQIILGKDMERAIGPIRFFIVYFSSGIFGFVMGGNFAPPGIASTGCSGSLFGIIGLVFIDLLYTWKERRHPLLDLIMMVVVVAVSFVIGLLPSGTDNFSHIGGFIMGLVLGVVILHSPSALRRHTGQEDVFPTRKRRTADDSLVYGTTGESTSHFFRHPMAFFKHRKPLWWAWWLVRAAFLVAVLVAFIVLINNFYNQRNNCSWCKYLSCLPVKNWCDIGNLTTTTTTTTQPATSSGTSPVRLALFM